MWTIPGPGETGHEPGRPVDKDGKKGLGQASKTCWLYLLDRETGKRLLPIPETAVPQNSKQRTSKTQPIPSYPPFIPLEVTDEHVQAIKELAKAGAYKGMPVIKAKTPYAPFDDKAIHGGRPRPAGRDELAAAELQPEDGDVRRLRPGDAEGRRDRRHRRRLPDHRPRPQAKDLAKVQEQVTNGGNRKPAFESQLSPAEIKNVSAYVVEQITGKK